MLPPSRDSMNCPVFFFFQSFGGAGAREKRGSRDIHGARWRTGRVRKHGFIYAVDTTWVVFLVPIKCSAPRAGLAQGP
jgi:hypothetical protein